MQLTLLRSFALHVDGTGVLLPLGIQRIVAYLALTDRPVGRMRLAGTLWPDTTDARAAANLRCGLWRLRQTKLPIVESVSDQVRLNESIEVDVRIATGQARRALDLTSADVPDDLDYHLLTADLLEDWYDEWVQIEREHFRHIRLHALEALCQRLVHAGRPVEAIQAGLAAVAGEPLRESAQMILIQAHMAEGNRYEAIRQYRSYCALLKRELNLEPSRHCQAVMAEVASESSSSVDGTDGNDVTAKLGTRVGDVRFEFRGV